MLSRQRKRGRTSRRDPETPRVVDDLPRPVPISRAELEVIEAFLGAQIDALLREFTR
ncbi:protein of unassigned function [Methylobacterium oryzae CBMB20]|uniref:Protein of unassigned function n=1 Tax=Methylobacterium oryzae CBMB20 TaxID=693986 RepID=A0A089NPW0_9HYPH|nr:protein of unassigned function [Methylobacterium oryzae CBMB20]